MSERGPTFRDDEGKSGPPQYSETVNISPIEGKLKILFLAANPADRTQLKLAEEYREVLALIRASEFRDRIEVTIRPATRHSDLAQALMEVKPHVVHFSGHGSDRDELVFQDDRGNSHSVSHKAIVELFKILKDDIRLVVLNACYSEPQAEGIVENIAFAIGMNRAIGDKAAIQFAKGLYQGIGFGRTVQEAFDLGKNALQMAGIGEELKPRLLNHPKADSTNVRLVTVGGVANENRQADEASMTSEAVDVWKDKLRALLQTEPLEDDPTRKLRYKRQIDECRQKIRELTANP